MNAPSAIARVDSITAQIHELEATLKIDEEGRQKTMVRSSIAGTVVSLAARPGQMLSTAQAAAPLLRIADLSEMTVARFLRPVPEVPSRCFRLRGSGGRKHSKPRYNEITMPTPSPNRPLPAHPGKPLETPDDVHAHECIRTGACPAMKSTATSRL